MDAIATHAARRPDALALIEGERRLTWGQFGEQRDRLAAALVGLGLARGEHVVIYSPNSIEYLLASTASRAAGVVPVPMNHRLSAEEVAYVLDDSDAALVFVADAFVPLVEKIRDGSRSVRHWVSLGSQHLTWATPFGDLLARAPLAPLPIDDSGNIGGSMTYTAGTTGKPKGALRRAVDPAAVLPTLQALDLAREHVHLAAGPLYHSAPGAFADVAWMDEEGFVYICDRKRDMIISGGANIYPAEIEDVLHRHPAVADVAVFGVPDDDWGERVHAAVELRPNAAASAEEIVAFAREHLAGYKAPREVSFHQALPRDTAGKLVKRVLREPHWAGRASRV